MVSLMARGPVRDAPLPPPLHPPTEATSRLLEAAHFHLPWLLTVVFLSAFMAHSIVTARPSEESAEPVLTGPGGKPLPQSASRIRQALRKKKQLEDFSPGRKLLFCWLSAGVLATYLGNILCVVLHALQERETAWWCGEATAVCQPNSMVKSVLTLGC